MVAWVGPNWQSHPINHLSALHRHPLNHFQQFSLFVGNHPGASRVIFGADFDKNVYFRPKWLNSYLYIHDQTLIITIVHFMHILKTLLQTIFLVNWNNRDVDIGNLLGMILSSFLTCRVTMQRMFLAVSIYHLSIDRALHVSLSRQPVPICISISYCKW